MVTVTGDGVSKSLLLELRSAALDHLTDGIWLAETSGDVVYRNPVAADMETMFWSRAGAVGTMEDLVFGPATELVAERDHFITEFHLTGADDAERNVVLEIRRIDQPPGLMFHARDVSREWLREQSLHDRHTELEHAYRQLKETQIQLLQSEKMASIGQLAAGVAHEINNPIGYVHSNLGTLQTYMTGLLRLLDEFESLTELIDAELRASAPAAAIRKIKQQIDYSFVRADLPNLLTESREGIERVKKIVLDLRDFSHSGQDNANNWVRADLHAGIESTINIVWNELKYKATVRREFGVLPRVECMPSQLNQVFLNLLVNAGQAIEANGEIVITTRALENEVCVSIRDNGAGIPADVRKHIFDPFFTTKPVGKGTGLGLSLSYGIVKNHQGRIELESEVGVGSVFHVYLPITQAGDETQRATKTSEGSLFP